MTDIDRIRELEAKATPGPWVASKGGGSWGVYYAGNIVSEATSQIVVTSANSANGQFIAAARNILPSLLAAVDERDKRIAELERECLKAKAQIEAALTLLDEQARTPQ